MEIYPNVAITTTTTKKQLNLTERRREEEENTSPTEALYHMNDNRDDVDDANKKPFIHLQIERSIIYWN